MAIPFRLYRRCYNSSSSSCLIRMPNVGPLVSLVMFCLFDLSIFFFFFFLKKSGFNLLLKKIFFFFFYLSEGSCLSPGPMTHLFYCLIFRVHGGSFKSTAVMLRSI
ncbi:hypothetical protein BDV25DRAFT_147805 [Aspergillus avenaceus]|uniref:Uncharacterized protein n=1 Tax=Aspergillus avenaceus TaxID=36643 RepID=A0A5N6U8R9_ASPAV|nr:hypothetical protein BDV25DRAFT_147805 [Aspergillus avenaceus]